MEGTMKYGFGAMDALAGDISSGSARINGLLEDLRSQINSVGSSWEGEAQGAFMQLKNNWESAANDLNAVMARIGTAVQTTVQDAQATEKSNAGRFGA
jgi:ESAT-6 family protein